VAGASRQELDRRAPHSSGRASAARAADGPSAACGGGSEAMVSYGHVHVRLSHWLAYGLLYDTSGTHSPQEGSAVHARR
jgi:hypothetical protein